MRPKKESSRMSLERRSLGPKKKGRQAENEDAKEEENQKNFNSFIHSINIILDMVFLYTLYIFKGTYAQSIDCGVKKVCEGFKHRMVRASSTVRCFEMSRVYAPTNGNRKKKPEQRRRNNDKKKSFSSGGKKLIHWVYGIFVKSEPERKKAVHTDISMCLYLILCLSSERCYCRHPKSELPSPHSPMTKAKANRKKKKEKNSRVLIRSKICVPYIVNVLFFI